MCIPSYNCKESYQLCFHNVAHNCCCQLCTHQYLHNRCSAIIVYIFPKYFSIIPVHLTLTSCVWVQFDKPKLVNSVWQLKISSSEDVQSRLSRNTGPSPPDMEGICIAPVKILAKYHAPLHNNVMYNMFSPVL